MRPRLPAALGAAILASSPATATPEPSYGDELAAIAATRQALAASWRASDHHVVDDAEAAILDGVTRLVRHWLGTRWALGAPQTQVPGQGKVNCGTFVATVLRDVGFQIDVKKLQRQPSQLIIRTFVGPSRTKKLIGASMDRFLAEVSALGPGLFIIGLDFHVGFLVQSETELRFIHASYELGTVVDEPAAIATPIVTSRYRVVGKLFDQQNIEDWLRGRRIAIVGNW